MDAFWIILTGSLVATSCGLLGCYLVLRKMSMVGDAISHAVLPGIVIAYMATGSGASVPVLIGASAMGILATVMIEAMHKKGKLQEDASIGLTFTWLFAIGVILISLFTRNVHLDTDCVLFGEIAYVPLDIIVTSDGVNLGPRNVWILGAVLIIILLMILVGYKGLFLTTFDAGFAASLGFSTVFWHYLLMGAVSLTTVVSFESVGGYPCRGIFDCPGCNCLFTYRQPENHAWAGITVRNFSLVFRILSCGVDRRFDCGGYDYRAGRSIYGSVSLLPVPWSTSCKTEKIKTYSVIVFSLTGSFLPSQKRTSLCPRHAQP